MSPYIAVDLDNLFEQKFFSHLDYFFTRSLARAFKETDPLVLVACALVSKSLFEGHICLDIHAAAGVTRPVTETGNTLVKFPEFFRWIKALQASPLVSGTIQTPLVLDPDHRLYLSKYYDFQQRLAQNIGQRVLLPRQETGESFLDDLLESFLPGSNAPVLHQKTAVKKALLNHFTLISGGPGTGKTFVTAIIKKMFFALAEKLKRPEPKIICLAPTGKAASKMEQGSTIHAALKPLKSGPGFYHDKNNPLKADVVIIDEASMIDILLLTRLLEAVPMTARVIILGDNHQLSSIQAGSVFCDICSVQGLHANLCFLEYNFRSRGKTGIEKLARAINANDAMALESVLLSGGYPDVVFKSLEDGNDISLAVKDVIIKGYHSFSHADTLDEALGQLDAFKILCAHNSGEYGTLQINHVCENILRSEHNFDIEGTFFKRIIMVKTNDYKKGLFNGDTGIVFEKKEGVNAFFISQDSTIQRYRASDLPVSDTAFAITIHKSQGSEFKTVLMIVPDKLSPVMTRQLLYTGVTRAKTKVIIIGNINIIKKAASLSVKRNSGLTGSLEKAVLMQ